MGGKSSKLIRIIGVQRVKRLPSTSSTQKGYIPISVGVKEETCKRFMVHTRALGDEDFVKLLCRSAEEYGFRNQGILRIPYETRAFEEWIAKQKVCKLIRPT